MRFVGGSIGYTIYYAIFVQKLETLLPQTIVEYAVQAGLPPADAAGFVKALLTAPDSTATLPGVTPKVLAAATIGSRWGYAKALSFVWYTSLPFGVIAAIVCLCLPDIRKFMTSRVAAKIERH